MNFFVKSIGVVFVVDYECAVYAVYAWGGDFLCFLSQQFYRHERGDVSCNDC